MYYLKIDANKYDAIEYKEVLEMEYFHFGKYLFACFYYTSLTKKIFS